MTIIFVAPGYPSIADPTAETFVQAEARGLADEGCHVVVITPTIWAKARDRNGRPYHNEDYQSTKTDGHVEVYRPSYFSIPTRFCFKLPFLNLRRFKAKAQISVVRRLVKRHRIKADVVMAMFLYESGWIASEVARDLGVKCFVEVGEGLLATSNHLHTPKQLSTLLRHIHGYIPNGSHLGAVLTNQLHEPVEKVRVLPNGIDLGRFSPQDKVSCKKKFGFPEDKLVVCSVGHFLWNKGLCRVAEAINGLDGVVGAFAGGGGDCPPVCDNMIFCDRVNHDDLPEFLSACDVFVLPTLVEGCSNATQEAICCGLPIIVSNNDQVADLVDKSYAITVDPLDISAIRKAVVKLRDDELLRSSMGLAASMKGRRFDMKFRCHKILDIMSEL